MRININADHEQAAPTTQEQKIEKIFMVRKDIIAYNVRHLRRSYRMSRDDVAARCGLSAHSINQAERPDVDIKLTTLIKIAQGFGITLERLIGGRIK
nr:MAG TPA: helix-turn-helix domain protein [Caudoviricetes sp.]